MKIETGKFYKTRDGRKVGPMESRGGDWIATPRIDPDEEFDWYSEGIFSLFGESPHDIISEWPTLTPHQQRTADMIKVMQAYVDGEGVEVLGYVSKKWVECYSPIWNWKDVDYRIAPATTPDTIDWSHVATEFKYMVRDPDGEVYLYKNIPVLHRDCWSSDSIASDAESHSSYRPGTCDWKDSLVKRPE